MDDDACVPAGPDSCYNRFESIPSALYFTLLNLLGEDPVLGYHSFDGRVIVTPRNRAEEGKHCRSPNKIRVR